MWFAKKERRNSMTTQQDNRLRRAQRQRTKIRKTTSRSLRLSVHRTNLHMYAQIIDDSQSKTIISVSTLSKDLTSQFKNGSTVQAAALVGKQIAQEAKKKGINQIVFDRSGFLYHGRVKALADSARENGLEF